jgi:hypothetical protein
MKMYPVFGAALLVVITAFVMVYMVQTEQTSNLFVIGGSQEIKANSKENSVLSADLAVVSGRNLKRLTEGCLAGKNCAEIINKPGYIGTAYVKYMDDDDMIIGLNSGNSDTAFPVKILAWHQAVKAKFDGKDIIVSYSPLTAAIGVYAAKIGDKTVLPEISDKLLNNNTVFLDKASKSLINQFDGVVLSGLYTGEKLERLPFVYMTWKDWKKKYPRSQVLGLPDDGLDYDVFPYEGYTESPTIYFPVENENSRLAPKEIIYAVSVGDHVRAYSAGDMEKLLLNKISSFSDVIGDIRIKFSYSDGGWEIVDLADDTQIIPYISYWFAWTAFNPKSDFAVYTDFQPID